MTVNEFRQKLKESNIVLPPWVIEYIEDLEKNTCKKKVVYTVYAILQHDTGVEERRVYSGDNPRQALKYCYNELSWLIDTRDDYGYPFDDFGEKFPGEKWIDKSFTGLEIKQMFMDYIKSAIDNKQSICYDLRYHDDWDVETNGEAAGFKLDITEF